jgi:hypothetical protein
MPKLKRPSVKDLSDKKVLGEAERKFMKELIEKVHQDDTDRYLWKMKATASNNQRLGNKMVLNEPYPNAPDIPLPETDKLISKQTPNLILSIWANQKMCSVKPEQGSKPNPEWDEKAKRVEQAMNMILRTKMNLFETLELAADYAKNIGHCIFRVVEKWNKRIVHKMVDLEEYDEATIKQLKKASTKDLQAFLAERYALDMEDEEDVAQIASIIDQFKSGETQIEFDVTEVYSYPCIEAPNPMKVVVPTYTTCLEYATRICFEYEMAATKLEEKMEEGLFEKRDIEELLKLQSKGEEDQYELDEKDSEGIEDSNSIKDCFHLLEVESFYKPKGAKRAERWVFTFVKGVKDPELACIKKHKFPYEFECWNYVRYDNEKRSPRHYSSRGVPEKIRGIQEMMERSLNNALIRDEMNNTPAYQVLDTSDLLRRNEYFYPSEMVPVKTLNGEIAPLNQPNQVDLSSERLLQLMKAYAEEYQYPADQLFRNATNVGGGKTLGEIREGINVTQKPTRVEVIRWNEALSKVFTQVKDVLKERLNSSVYLPNGTEVTREDFMIPLEVKANGQLEVADSDLMTQKAFNRYQVVSSPVNVDFVTIEDRYNAFKDWLEKDGCKDPDQFSTDPKEVLQDQVSQLKQQAMQLQQQVGMMEKQLMQGTEDLSKMEQKGKDVVAKTSGKLKAKIDDDRMERESMEAEAPAGQSTSDMNEQEVQDAA